MFTRTMGRWAMVSFAGALVALLALRPILSAAPKSDGEKPSATGKAVDKRTSKSRTANKPVTTSERPPRMPAHFNKIVDEQQRAKVLTLLTDYAPRIAAKRAELKALVDERDEAVLGVLTPKQRQQVEAYRAESNAKRAAALAAGRQAESKEAAPSKPKAANE